MAYGTLLLSDDNFLPSLSSFFTLCPTCFLFPLLFPHPFPSWTFWDVWQINPSSLDWKAFLNTFEQMTLSPRKTFRKSLLYLPTFRTDGLPIKSDLGLELKEFCESLKQNLVYCWRSYLQLHNAYNNLFGQIQVYSNICFPSLGLWAYILNPLLVDSFIPAPATLTTKWVLIRKYTIRKN